MLLHKIPEWRKRLCWEAIRLWEQLSYLAIASLSLLLLWAGITCWVNQPLANQLQQVREMAHQEGRREAIPKPASSVPDINAGLAGFLPSESQREQQLLQLYALVEKHNLLRNRVDYRTEAVRHLAPLQHLSLRLSLQGSYAQHRKFLHDALATLPNLAVENIAIEKMPNTNDSFTTQLTASLYYRGTATKDMPL